MLDNKNLSFKEEYYKSRIAELERDIATQSEWIKSLFEQKRMLMEEMSKLTSQLTEVTIAYSRLAEEKLNKRC
jgi:uncharacterized coiled-coil protein SlyX